MAKNVDETCPEDNSSRMECAHVVLKDCGIHSPCPYPRVKNLNHLFFKGSIIMNKPHKWAKEICHMANGGVVEWSYVNGSHSWWPIYGAVSGVDWDDSRLQYRIAVEKKFAGDVCKEAWYAVGPGQHGQCIKKAWENAAKAVIQAYKNNELKEEYCK